MEKPKVPTDDTPRPLIHPYTIFMVLILGGITILFISFSGAYLYSRIENQNPPIQLPIIFVFNTMLLLGSSACIIWAKKSYLADNTKNYIKALKATIVLTILFMIFQGIGWYQLLTGNMGIASSNAAGYLHIISIVHFTHIIAGLPFLIIFLRTAIQRMKEPVSVLVYFSDPEKALKLKLLTWYWHFLDILWVYLVLFFWVNYLVG